MTCGDWLILIASLTWVSLWLFSLSTTFAPSLSMTWLALAIWSVTALLSSGKQSILWDHKVKAQPDDGSGCEPKLSVCENFSCYMFNEFFGLMWYTILMIFFSESFGIYINGVSNRVVYPCAETSWGLTLCMHKILNFLSTSWLKLWLVFAVVIFEKLLQWHVQIHSICFTRVSKSLLEDWLYVCICMHKILNFYSTSWPKLWLVFAVVIFEKLLQWHVQIHSINFTQVSKSWLMGLLLHYCI